MVQSERSAGELCKLLVIDGDAAGLETLAQGLREGGYRVVALSRAEAAVPLFGVFRPDAVIVAVDPDGDVLRIARRLRRRGQGGTPLILLLSNPDESTRLRCLEDVGAVQILPREVSAMELLAVVRAQVGYGAAAARVDREARSPGSHLRDGLTGAATPAFLLALLSQELRRAERYGGCFCLVVADLRRFGDFRRRFGQELSERLVVYASMVLGQAVREADVVARIGHHRFGVLLPCATAESLPALMRRLEERLEAGRLDLGGAIVRPSFALGAVAFPDVIGTAEELLAKAGGALGRAEGLEPAAYDEALGTSA